MKILSLTNEKLLPGLGSEEKIFNNVSQKMKIHM